jgi:hypothetical protein
MATIYVSHTGSNTSPYDTKAKAANSIVTAAAASLAGDTILLDHTHTGDNAVTATLLITLKSGAKLISWDFANDVQKPMGVDAWLGHSSGTARAVTIESEINADPTYIYGITLRNVGSSSGVSAHLQIGKPRTAGVSTTVIEDCYLWLGNAHASARILIGSTSSNQFATVDVVRATLRFSNSGQYFLPQGEIRFTDCTLSTAGTVPNTLAYNSSSSQNITMAGCDWSAIGAGSLLGGGTGAGVSYLLTDCKLDPATALLSGSRASAMSINNYPERPMVHANEQGTTQALKDDGSTIPVTTDAPQTWGDIGCVWMMTTSAAASLIAPYVSPWISIDVEAVNGVTPYVEILRNNSATAYTDHEVWAEWQYKASALTERVDTIVTRPAITASPSSLPAGAATWSHASATKWVGKLTVPAAIDIKRDGQLRVRICVGKASVSNLYVDPQIRV